jgi:hypothetical protein
MDPQLTGFALGLLLGTAKIMTIGTVGFAIAWWRARARIRGLEEELREAERASSIPAEERLRRIEESLERLASRVETDAPARPALPTPSVAAADRSRSDRTNSES